jgi:hypothetical protein
MSGGRGRKWVTVAVDRETYDMLKAIGEEEGIMSTSSVIKYLAKQYIKSHPELRLKEKSD